MIKTAEKIAGWLMFASMVLTIMSSFVPLTGLWIPSLIGWLSALLLVSAASKDQKKISILLLIIGIVAWLLAWYLGISLDWQKALSMNQSLITLFIGVHFLRLVALPDSHEEEQLPHGERAFLTSFLGVHVLGAVINLSSVIFVGDRISRNRKLTKEQVILLIRALASAAFWSPFFAGFGAAMVFAEGASLTILLTTGLFTALIALGISFVEFKKESYENINNFAGFPIHFDAFRIPLLLAILVLIAHQLAPDFKVTLLVAMLSCIMTLVILSAKKGTATAIRDFSGHVTNQLPGMRGELMLYLSAGLLGSGLSALIGGLSITLPISQLTGTSSVVVLGCMLLASRLGIHPVISIAVVGGWFLPLNPDHTLLATMFLFSWGVGVCVNPFSGINLMMLGRYQTAGKDIVRWNTLYALKLYAVASAILMLQSQWLGV
jgi:hypothetical protein